MSEVDTAGNEVDVASKVGEITVKHEISLVRMVSLLLTKAVALHIWWNVRPSYKTTILDHF